MPSTTPRASTNALQSARKKAFITPSCSLPVSGFPHVSLFPRVCLRIPRCLAVCKLPLPSQNSLSFVDVLFAAIYDMLQVQQQALPFVPTHTYHMNRAYLSYVSTVSDCVLLCWQMKMKCCMYFTRVESTPSNL